MSRAIGKALPASVVSYRYATIGQGWTYRHPSRAFEERKRLALWYLRQRKCAGMGTADVVEYYRSVDLDELSRRLTALKAPQGAIAVFIEAARQLQSMSNIIGLPIGCEASGAMGNVYLLAVDGLGAAVRLGYLRYTDDIWVFVRTPDDWVQIRGYLHETLHNLGLKANLRKESFYDKESAKDVVRSARLSSFDSSGPPMPEDTALELLTDALDAQGDCGTELRFALGALKRHTSIEALEIVLERPDLLLAEPRCVGNFLGHFAHQTKALDPDWLAEIAYAPRAEPASWAGRLHACRVAARFAQPKAAGQRYREVLIDRSRRAPLRAWAAIAWARSEDWKPGIAAELAEQEAELPIRRALAAGYRGKPKWRKTEQAFEKLRRMEPDLAPTLQWATTRR